MYGGSGSNHNRNESVARRRASMTFNKSPLSPGKLRSSPPNSKLPFDWECTRNI